MREHGERAVCVDGGLNLRHEHGFMVGQGEGFNQTMLLHLSDKYAFHAPDSTFSSVLIA